MIIGPKNNEFFELPDGTKTTDTTAWSAAWVKITAPLKQAGLDVVAFNPEIIVVRKFGEQASLPVWVVEAVGKAINGGSGAPRSL